MNSLIYTFVLVLAISGKSFGDSENYQCIWYGELIINEYTVRNIYYNGSGKPIHDEIAIDIVRKRCGDIYQSE